MIVLDKSRLKEDKLYFKNNKILIMFILTYLIISWIYYKELIISKTNKIKVFLVRI